MSIAGERPPTAGSARPPRPPLPAEPAEPAEPAGSAAPAGASATTALTMASIRISRGNPTSEETAAVAALLVAGLRRLHETGPSAEPRARRLPHRPGPAYRAPGSWAS
ncbi:hypothetical protein OQI_04595 [Streptomyces pharetrae CZA14]|uniref:Acyl-CoA carboxylase subunit epsilon n=1 Tax=Streptomyces pharetrae CZA14 TaxID=1144883 RepID=A0ABX3YNR1_9ACTN|nr:hypothetical protein OQI_04595 [Streptomyces pharetrae CZA14]